MINNHHTFLIFVLIFFLLWHIIFTNQLRQFLDFKINQTAHSAKLSCYQYMMAKPRPDVWHKTLCLYCCAFLGDTETQLQSRSYV